MLSLGLRQLQDALDGKANELQREFVAISDRLQEIGPELLEAETEEEKDSLGEERDTLKARQIELADEINDWREHARNVVSQPGETSLRAYLEQLDSLEDAEVQGAIKQTKHLLDASPEEIEAFLAGPEEAATQTEAARLIERARTEFDLRSGDPAPRQRAALEFANRQGLAQQDEVIDEIEGYMEDSDPIVRELAVLTTIELHRYRALRIADLDTAHDSVQRLANVNHLAAIQPLIEVVENPRSGFVEVDGEPVEEGNDPSRLVALLRLIQWHTKETQRVVKMRRFDQSQAIVNASKRALELFPGVWEGPIQEE